MSLRVARTLAAAVLAVSLGACTSASESTHVTAASSPVAPKLTSRILDILQRVHRGGTWDDPLDASVGWVDITRVRYNNEEDVPYWVIELAAPPPPAASLEPGQLIAYGLVLDTTGDEVADYVVGIDNETPRRGDFHVWVTDLRTGRTDERIGPPYGLPIEFSYPNEGKPGGLSDPRTLVLTFLTPYAPPDLDPETVRFYAWASASRDYREVFASDYAPDTGWMTRA